MCERERRERVSKREERGVRNESCLQSIPSLAGHELSRFSHLAALVIPAKAGIQMAASDTRSSLLSLLSSRPPPRHSREGGNPDGFR